MASQKVEKRMVLVLKDKGGVGASFFARLLWERMVRLNLNAQAFDADGTTGSLAKHYAEYDARGEIVVPQPTHGVTPLWLHGSVEDRDQIATVISSPADTVLVDLPATALTVFERIEGAWGFFREAHLAGWKITCVVVITPFEASIANVRRIMDLSGASNIVVVLNGFFGTTKDFRLWDGDPQAGIPVASAKTDLPNRGVEIEMPRLEGAAPALLDAFNLPFDGALTDPRFSIPDRGYVRRFLDDFNAEIRDAAGLLGLNARKLEPAAQEAAQ